MADRFPTRKGDLTVPGVAYVDGRDLDARPPLTLALVNLWNAPQRSNTVGQLAHGTVVEVQEVVLHVPENRYYFLVRAGRSWGWLPEGLLSPDPREPVGDLM